MAPIERGPEGLLAGRRGPTAPDQEAKAAVHAVGDLHNREDRTRAAPSSNASGKPST